MQLTALLALLPVLAIVSAAPHLQHAPRSTPTSTRNHLAEVHVKPDHAKHHRRHSDEGAWYSDGPDGTWQQEGSPTEYQAAEMDAPSATSSTWAESTTMSSETMMSTIGPTPKPEYSTPMSDEMPMSTPTSYAPSMSTSMPMTASKTMSMSDMAPSATGDAAMDAAAQDEPLMPSTSAAAPKETEKEKGKKIRYKQCPSSGTVSQIKVTPCEGGKGTILDPCHFHAGSYVSLASC
jgi:hypothetical protein